MVSSGRVVQLNPKKAC